MILDVGWPAGNWLLCSDEVYVGLLDSSEVVYDSCFDDGSARCDLMTAVSTLKSE